jgi:hypothetical protein
MHAQCALRGADALQIAGYAAVQARLTICIRGTSFTDRKPLAAGARTATTTVVAAARGSHNK